jgi:hypothetical protein
LGSVYPVKSPVSSRFSKGFSQHWNRNRW